MGLGLVLLESASKENIILNEKPDITFFKAVYNMESNITNEILPQYFKSQPNFGKRMTVNISKNGDMIEDMSLYFELPEIPQSNHSSLPKGIKKFAWVDKIGLAIIKNIDIEIGGILISRHYNDWLNIYNELTVSDMNSYNKMIGSNQSINKYTNGKNNYSLHVPLSFFFNLNNGLSNNNPLPLIALTKQDVKIHIELNDFSACYKESPTNYFTINSYICLYRENETIRQNVNGTISIGIFVYFDINTNRVYYDSVYNTFLIPQSNDVKYNIVGDISYFTVMPSLQSIIVKDENYFSNNIYSVLKNAYLLVNYIYLDSNERWYFMNNEINYIIPIVLNVLSKDINSMNSNYKLQLFNMHGYLIWRAQLSNNITINDVFNYSSLPLTLNSEPLIQSNKLVINSIPRCELSNNEYYTVLQSYINKNTSNNNIYQYNFGLNKDFIKPQGTLNFSMIDNTYVQLNLNKLVNYQNTINVKAYGIYYTIFVVKNGNSSIKFYN